jgi:hypothetical protein
MSQQSGFMPQRQFHVLVNEANEDQPLTVMPDPQGNFRVIKQGEVLGEVNYTPQSKIVCYKGRSEKSADRPAWRNTSATIATYAF